VLSKGSNDCLICFAIVRACRDVNMESLIGALFNTRLSAVWMCNNRDAFQFWRRGSSWASPLNAPSRISGWPPPPGDTFLRRIRPAFESLLTIQI
jgi:hypothetical protein